MSETNPHSQSEQDESSLNDVITSAKDALQSKQYVFLALSNVVKAEVGLAKKATLVAFFATLAVLIFSCFCWLLINVAMGYVLVSTANINVGLASLLLLAVNAGAAYFALVVLKQSFAKISLAPTFEAIMDALFSKASDKD